MKKYPVLQAVHPPEVFLVKHQLVVVESGMIQVAGERVVRAYPGAQAVQEVVQGSHLLAPELST